MRQNERRLQKLEGSNLGDGALYVLRMRRDQPDQDTVAADLIVEAGFPAPTPREEVMILHTDEHDMEPRLIGYHAEGIKDLMQSIAAQGRPKPPFGRS